MKISSLTEESFAWEHIPESFFTNAIMTYDDIDLEGLEGLGIVELRCLAHKVGVLNPISKTQDELVVEISKKVEQEMEYFYSSCSAL